MLARRRSRFMLTSSQPVHIQHHPTGESCDSVFTRHFVGTSRVKTLAVPVDQPIHSIDIVYRILRTRQKNDCFKKFDEILESAVIGRFIGVCASWQLSGDLLRSPEVSGNRSACQEWWARLWALRTPVSMEVKAAQAAEQDGRRTSVSLHLAA